MRSALANMRFEVVERDGFNGIVSNKVLLIDDVINLLEDKHERKLIDLLMTLKEDHTIVVITHSKRLLDRADLILDINNSEVNTTKG